MDLYCIQSFSNPGYELFHQFLGQRLKYKSFLKANCYQKMEISQKLYNSHIPKAKEKQIIGYCQALKYQNLVMHALLVILCQ